MHVARGLRGLLCMLQGAFMDFHEDVQPLDAFERMCAGIKKKTVPHDSSESESL